mgnify:CR=1 FL=1
MLISATKYLHYLQTFERIADYRRDDNNIPSIEEFVNAEYQNTLRSYLLLLDLSSPPIKHQVSYAQDLANKLEVVSSTAYLTTLSATLPRVTQNLYRLRKLTDTDRVEFKHSYEGPYSKKAVCVARMDPQSGFIPASYRHTFEENKEMRARLNEISVWARVLFGVRRTDRQYSINILEAYELARRYHSIRQDLMQTNPVEYFATCRIFSLILKSTPLVPTKATNFNQL